MNISIVSRCDKRIFICKFDISYYYNKFPFFQYGLGTQEEMCMAMLEYYPKRKRYSDNCESANQPVPLMKKLGAKVVTIDDASGSVIVTDTNDRQQPFLEWIKTLAWTDAMIASYQWFIRNNSHSLTCGIN
jgi:hypothetical protein